MSEYPVVIFGEVLFDKFPGGQTVLGGAPFNVAWHLTAFNVSPQLVSGIGNDKHGQDVIAAMRNWNMSTSHVQITDKPTGMVTVEFNNNEPSYTIEPGSAWDYISHQPVQPDHGYFLYHGSLAARSDESRHALEELVRHSGVRFMDINLRPPWYNMAQLKSLCRSTNWLKINSDELNVFTRSIEDQDDKLAYMHERYSINHIILTCGEQGAIYSHRNNEKIKVKPSIKSKIVDTVGAGDAFSSVIILGIVNNWEMSTSLERAQEFASEIVQQRGATVSDPVFYNKFMNKWQL